MNKIRKNWLFVYSILVFLFFAYFFLQLHPIMMRSYDDWLYQDYSRLALPIWKGWNPSRVLPEVLAPICGNISAFIVTPITGDYVWSFSVTTGLVVSLVATAYIMSFYCMMHKCFGFRKSTATFLSAFFLLMHFSIFRSMEQGNPYLFYSWELDCFYFYVIPNVLNALIVLISIQTGVIDRICKAPYTWKKAVFLLGCYLAVASNVFGSIIFGAYVSLILFYRLLLCLRVFKWKAFVSANSGFLVCFAFWLMIQVFELLGGRAATLNAEGRSAFNMNLLTYDWRWTGRPPVLAPNHGNSLVDDFVSASEIFLQVVRMMNNWVRNLLLLMTVVVSALLIIYRRQELEKKFTKAVLLSISMFVIVTIYNLLASAKSRPYYIGRPDVMASGFYCLISLLVVEIAYLVKKYKPLVYLLPWSLLLFYTQTNTASNTFREVVGLQEHCYEYNTDLVRCMKEADRQGIDSIEIHGRTGIDDLILKDRFCEFFSRELVKHGQISHPIYIKPIKERERKTLYWNKLKNDE